MNTKDSFVLNFSFNWNNKLNGNCFTTLRLHNPAKYEVGRQFTITLKNRPKGIARLVAVKHFELESINEYIGRLDTGYSAEETKKLIREMYKNKPICWNTQLLDFCLLEYTEKKQSADLFNSTEE